MLPGSPFWQIIKHQAVNPNPSPSSQLFPINFYNPIGRGSFAASQAATAAGPQIIAWNLAKGKNLTCYDWIPTCEPTPGMNFLDVDRSMDPIRLAGHRRSFDPTRDNITEKILQLSGQIARYGGNPDTMFISKAWRTGTPLEKVSFLYTPCGKLNIVEDDTCVSDIFLIDINSWVKSYDLVCVTPYANGRLMMGNSKLINRPPVVAPRCVCGSGDVTGPGHSTWCDIFKKDA